MAKRPTGVNPLAREASLQQCKSMADKDKSREEKLARALRDNLRKRKARARQLKPEDRPARD